MNDQQRASRIATEAMRDRSQRMRVGMTGLFVIVLIVGLATLLLSRLNENARPNDAGVAATSANSSPAEVPVEPLSELGVAPEAPQPAAAAARP